jgi:hypothetical protein
MLSHARIAGSAGLRAQGDTTAGYGQQTTIEWPAARL